MSDLQQIRGIGPGVARRLSEAGIRDVADLAEAEPEIVAAALKGMPVVTQERIVEWIVEAGRLAPARESAPTGNGQHYATFKVELLLSRHNEVRRTRISHVQSGGEASWAGWEPGHLADFLVENTGLQPPSPGETPKPPPQPTRSPDEPRLHGLEITIPGTREPHPMVRHGQPFDVGFSVELPETKPEQAQGAARMTTALYARALGEQERRQLSQSVVMLPLSPEIEMRVGVAPGHYLSPGAYRLEVELDMETEDPRRHWPTASLRQGMLVVF